MTTLYHYCDANAFMSIVKNKKLWLSSTSKMNDLNEGSMITRALHEMVSRRYGEAPFDTVRSLSSAFKDELYACCFSSETDSTVQWMTYADSGRGLSIGFDSKKILQNHCDYSRELNVDDYFSGVNDVLIQNTFMLGPVVYLDKDNSIRILDSISSKLDGAHITNDSFDSEMLDLVQTCGWFDAITKDFSFRHENEYRITHAPKRVGSIQLSRTAAEDDIRPRVSHLDPLCWRTTRYGLAPYYEFPVPIDAISEIWLGPRNPDHPNIGGDHLLRMFCRQHDIQHARIELSASPYRG